MDSCRSPARSPTVRAEYVVSPLLAVFPVGKRGRGIHIRCPQTPSCMRHLLRAALTTGPRSKQLSDEPVTRPACKAVKVDPSPDMSSRVVPSRFAQSRASIGTRFSDQLGAGVATPLIESYCLNELHRSFLQRKISATEVNSLIGGLLPTFLYIRQQSLVREINRIAKARRSSSNNQQYEFV